MVEEIQWIGDVAAICMCAVTVVLLVQQRARYRRNLPVRGVAGIVRNFNQEFRQFVGAGSAPLAILGKSEGEEGVTSENVINNDDSIAHPLSDPVQERGQAQERHCDAPVPSTGDRYREVKRLADMGLDTEEIFERVGLPKGEIELVLKVNRLRSGAVENTRPGNSFLA
jgi:hypothetical protein